MALLPLPAMTPLPLFDTPLPEAQTLSPGAVLLRGWARAKAAEWVAQVAAITEKAPFRVMLRPGGAPLSVAMTNCGAYGWVSDARRYRYSATDPGPGLPWPAMPAWLLQQFEQAGLLLWQRAEDGGDRRALAVLGCWLDGRR